MENYVNEDAGMPILMGARAYTIAEIFEAKQTSDWSL
jgi:hypothetical protein